MTGDWSLSRRAFCQKAALMTGALGVAPLLGGARFKPMVIKTAHLNTTDHGRGDVVSYVDVRFPSC
jgi:hypothetical protein